MSIGVNVVAHNLQGMFTNRQLGMVNNYRSKSSEKLSSGYKINRSADDAAGLSISEKMRKQIRGLDQGAKNIQDGISLCQVADGALAEVHDMLHRMTELSIKSANGTLSPSDRADIQSEVNELSKEINRIGYTTKFNDQLLFDSPDAKVFDGTITTLVSCASADKGCFGEAYEVSPGNYMPAAYLDFSNINSENIKLLDHGNFGFNCSRGCKEVFDITFTTDGTPSSASDLGDASHQQEHHKYVIDISNCKSGSDVVDAVLNYVGNNLPYQRYDNAPTYGDLRVSHSNHLGKVDNTKLVIYANQRVNGYGNYSITGFQTPEQAANAYPLTFSGYPQSSREAAGKIFCSGFSHTIQLEPVLDIPIQCSSDNTESNIEHVTTHRMNAKVIGVDPLDVSTQDSASNSIDKVSKALATISLERSEIGAQQNRLLHAYNTNLNTSENTTAAESIIRDTDMPSEMVRYANAGILQQAGQAMLSQANQSNQGVLSLLQ